MVWSMIPQTANTDQRIVAEQVKCELLDGEECLTTMLMIAWGWLTGNNPTTIAY